MDSTMMLMDVISAACAAYCAYTWVRLLRERKLFKNELLLGKDKKPEDCLDEDGYVSYVLPRLGVLTADFLHVRTKHRELAAMQAHCTALLSELPKPESIGEADCQQLLTTLCEQMLAQQNAAARISPVITVKRDMKIPQRFPAGKSHAFGTL